jgi:hypothetical protein
MSYEIGTATNAVDLLNKLNTFLTSKGKAYGLSYTGTGTGKLTGWDGGASSVSETFTITATSATSFNVVGSVSGSIGSATVGTLFTHAKLTFTITAGGTAFVAGDVFKINTCPPWVNQRSVAGSEMIWKTVGNDGLRDIYVGALLFSDAGADYYNWRLGGFNGYSSGQTFVQQPGFVGQPGPVLNLWNSTIPYWFVANGQRVIVFAKISTIYVSCYLGLINPYVDPGYWPYPLFVGGSMAWSTEPGTTSTNWRWSYSSNYQMANFWRGVPAYGVGGTWTTAQGRIRFPDGSYNALENYSAGDVVSSGDACSVWPFACDSPSSGSRGFQNIRENLDGSYPLLPIFFSSDRGAIAGDDTNTWGEFDGIRATTGHANAAENTITEGPLTYVVFQDAFRNEKDCYCALALD